MSPRFVIFLNAPEHQLLSRIMTVRWYRYIGTRHCRSKIDPRTYRKRAIHA